MIDHFFIILVVRLLGEITPPRVIDEPVNEIFPTDDNTEVGSRVSDVVASRNIICVVRIVPEFRNDPAEANLAQRVVKST